MALEFEDLRWICFQHKLWETRDEQRCQGTVLVLVDQQIVGFMTLGVLRSDTDLMAKENQLSNALEPGKHMLRN
jgi:hypothetical protein